MLQKGKIRPIQSPNASPVVLMRKNNGVHTDSPEAYRFAIDYRKLNGITKYPRYPSPQMDVHKYSTHRYHVDTRSKISGMIRWALKLSEFNIEWEHRPGVQNVVADVLSRNPVDNVDGSQISCAAL
ncbi:hypothetical protein TNCV_2076861 [Trichonephila clavipes]|nr:hypothetical protein TNCV_2076861 [Trichonephila clavipes]